MRLYIDPGTGSMLFTVALGLLSVLWFFLRKLYLRIKYLAPGAKADTDKKGIVLYCEDKRYFMTFESVCDEFEKRKIPVTFLTGSEDDPAFRKGYEYVRPFCIGTGNKAYAKLNLLNARVLLATTPGLDVYQWKRSKNVDYYVHMLHALRGVTTYRMFGTEFYDAILTSAEIDNIPIREMEEKRSSKEKELVVVGSTLMDHHAARFAAEGGNHPHEGISILLAPSWGPNSIFRRFGEKLIDALIATGFDITVRPHPQSFTADKDMMEKLQTKYPESERFHWNRDADNFDVLSRTDLMISDYSSVMFDFALVFDRPVIYADVQMDWSVYDQHWCDTPNYHLSVLPRIGLELREEDFPRLKEIIEGLIEDRTYAASRRAVRDECWEHQGEAAARIVDYLVGKEEQLRTVGVEQAAREQAAETPEEQSDTTDEPANRPAILRRRIAIIVLLGLLLASGVFACSQMLVRRTEHDYEIADLYVMRAAEVAAVLKWKDKVPEMPEEYWFFSKTAELLDMTHVQPEPYGMGTEKAGGGLKDFQEMTGITRYEYSERESYKDKIVFVRVSTDEHGDLQINLEWIPSDKS